METLNLCGKDNIFVRNSIVIRKLIEETTFAGIKTLINCYNPMIDTDIEMIKKHMLESTGLRGEKADVFKLAIKYVTNDHTEINEKNVDELTEMLIAAIKNRTSIYCDDCKKWYVVGRKDEPKTVCIMCKVGQHDCKPESRDEKRSGEKWFCCNCNEQFTNQNKVNKCRNVFFKGFERDEIQLVNDEIIKVRIAKLKELSKRDEFDQPESDESDEQETRKEDESKQDEKKTKTNNENESNKANDSNGIGSSKDTKKNGGNNNIGNIGGNNNNGNNNTIKNTCKYFVNSACFYGRSCRNFHPEVCKEWAKNGKCQNLNRGQGCKLVHQRKCRSIELQEICHKPNCGFLHPTNIKIGKQNMHHERKPQYHDNGYRMDQQSEDFHYRWPLPKEASMSLHRMME